MPSSAAPAAPGVANAAQVHRFEVTPAPGQRDPIGQSVARDAAAIGLAPASVRATHVYLVSAPLSATQLDTIARELLADPITERASVGSQPTQPGERVVEVHPLPGVMDPVAQSVALAIRELTGVDAEVASGWRYDIAGLDAHQARRLAQSLLANPVIHRVTDTPYTPASFPRGTSHEHEVRSIPIIALSDDQLVRLSREAHLFLSLDEMRSVQAHYRSIGREPRDIELETLAQTWSEHCVHKTLKSTVTYRDTLLPASGSSRRQIDWSRRPGTTVHADGSITIANMLKSTVAAATFELIADGVDWTLSVFKDNSGVIAFDENVGVCVKVETHNHPSAIEPYGGAATGAGGCIRDVIGTGLGAKPIANTDIFCVAFPDHFRSDADANATGADDSRQPLPPGTLHPRRVLTQVVAGVRDYGNRMGIPTVNGAVAFDDRYVGNPLVFCGCIGVIPRDKVKGAARPGDRIIAVGGRTGRDGIHGATFSSAELEQTASDEFAHAVQIGNAITEKQVLDAILRARDHADGCLYTAMTDCGAGGFSSAVGEMGSKLGAEVHLERAPLKYPGLSYTEIWISEAQERMVLAVPPENVAKLRAICQQEGVEIADLGHFGTPEADLILNFHGREVGRLSMALLHDGIPMPTREATWTQQVPRAFTNAAQPHIKDALRSLLSHPDIASKQFIIRQYDHEVQGATIVKPLVGPRSRGPADASVIEPVPGSGRGLAIANGLQTPVGDPQLGGDPYLMALAAVDECVRNLVCVGADPSRIAILDNFCWPSCAKGENLGSLLRACIGCYDAAKAYRTPFVSGKDSLNNQLKFTDPATGLERVIEIPPTLLISGIAIVPDIARCVTSDAKSPGNALLLVGHIQSTMGGSRYQQLFGLPSPAFPYSASNLVPGTNLHAGPAAARFVASLIAEGHARSAHDVSDGGLLCAVSEMLIGAFAHAGLGLNTPPAGPIGADLRLSMVHADPIVAAFSESPSCYVLEVEADRVPRVLAMGAQAGVPVTPIGSLNDSGVLTDPALRLSAVVGDLVHAFTHPLAW